ncbi:hypothetical protein [Marinococcus luteus]|uniref:hypothetical protein n=1 Tax=Marinococcus luteus TaxID=1122204 RepID=UPI002ACC9429|nr:hypothetical protein [Marinococcus luteus]MDZ5782169.1 hypothetical protein [Marinococcus luteus]
MARLLDFYHGPYEGSPGESEHFNGPVLHIFEREQLLLSMQITAEALRKDELNVDMTTVYEWLWHRGLEFIEQENITSATVIVITDRDIEGNKIVTSYRTLACRA